MVLSRIVATILYIIGTGMLLVGIGGPIAYILMGESPDATMIWAGIGGAVMGVLFIQGGRKFWEKD